MAGNLSIECGVHLGIQVTAVCVTCDATLVCVECITGELHQGHVFGKTSKIADDIKRKLNSKEANYCKVITSLESDLYEARVMKRQQDSEQKERVDSINTQRLILIHTVNEMADDFISKYEIQTQCNCVQLQDAIKDISSKLENIKRHRADIRRVIAEKEDIAVVHGSRKLTDFDEQRKVYPELASIEFTSGKVNTHQLKLMFGGKDVELEGREFLQGAQAPTNLIHPTNRGSSAGGHIMRQGIELVLQSSFKHNATSYVTRMCGESTGNTWLTCQNEREITLVDRTGQVQKNVTFDTVVISMTAVGENTLLVCGFDEREIRKVSLPSGRVTSAFSTGKLYPNYICTAPSGDLFVTLMEKRSFNVTSKSKRVLVRYSQKGERKDRARHDDRGDALFVWPMRMRISNTGEVLGGTNSTDKSNNHLVFLNSDLTVRLRYLGNGKVVSRKEKFDTTTYKPDTKYAIADFIFDKFDNIILCEAHSRRIQLVSRDCLPMLTLQSTQEHTPMAMTMTDDDIWLGFTDRTVQVYKYKWTNSWTTN
ncbi:uncharacterized protein LOC110445901 [Mizuhopecten yessoensis]|uniref:B box-type domain-containing protein n=1 Tax=Mizuhopecten yessoensis TaxID=6573 RepID=A0A210QYK0_MIZYE|nr:uncharacterized protein LOC110445901 [Mizuhopecten yessoensis]OWF53816.1 hypothetical protein KP79_PYT22465 [Mizuhopecten yessoensis]